jgi:DNA-binding HxlR family transcriptional regulator
MAKKHFNCPAEMCLSLFDGKWKVIILWVVRKGPQRSGKLRSRLPGITAAAFSNAVRELERDGLLKRLVRPASVPEVSYGLTARGESLSPIVKSLVKWGLQHQGDYAAGEFGMAKFYHGLKAASATAKS